MSTEPVRRMGRSHEAGFYRSDDEFRALTVPFAEDGVALDQPVIVVCDEPKAGLLERSAPAIELADPTAAQARHAVTGIGRGQLPDTALQDLVIGVSEAVSNARRHGRPR